MDVFSASLPFIVWRSKFIIYFEKLYKTKYDIGAGFILLLKSCILHRNFIFVLSRASKLEEMEEKMLYKLRCVGLPCREADKFEILQLSLG